MKNLWWGAYGRDCDFHTLHITFEDQANAPLNLREMVRQARLPRMVLIPPEVVDKMNFVRKDLDYYLEESSNANLTTYTGRNGSYDPFRHIFVTDTTFEYERYSGSPEWFPQPHMLDALDDLVALLVHKWRVERWKITAEWREDYGHGTPKYLAEGDHEAFLKYLELDEPEQ